VCPTLLTGSVVLAEIKSILIHRLILLQRGIESLRVGRRVSVLSCDCGHLGNSYLISNIPPQEFHFTTNKFHFMTDEIHFMTEPTLSDGLDNFALLLLLNEHSFSII